MFPACTTYAEDNHEKSHPLPPLPSLFPFSKSLCSQHPLCHFSSFTIYPLCLHLKVSSLRAVVFDGFG
jgi:hypothetical protein